jgi:hypothetical protein
MVYYQPLLWFNAAPSSWKNPIYIIRLLVSHNII